MPLRTGREGVGASAEGHPLPLVMLATVGVGGGRAAGRRGRACREGAAATRGPRRTGRPDAGAAGHAPWAGRRLAEP